MINSLRGCVLQVTNFTGDSASDKVHVQKKMNMVLYPVKPDSCLFWVVNDGRLHH